MLCEHAKNIFYPVYVEKAVEKYWSYDQPWGMPHATSHQLNFELWKTSFSVWQPSKFSMHLVAKLGRLEGYNGGRSCGNGAVVGDHVENLAKVEVSATRCTRIIRRSGHPPARGSQGVIAVILQIWYRKAMFLSILGCVLSGPGGFCVLGLFN